MLVFFLWAGASADISTVLDRPRALVHRAAEAL